jgi:hypothetical protein
LVERTAVLYYAGIVIRANSLAPLLPLVLNVDELAQPAHHSTYARGKALSVSATKH